MTGFIDIHQHILWGMDDGPASAKGMQAMLRKAHAQKVCCIAATPHAYPGFRPFDLVLYQERLEEARAYCLQERLNIMLMPGAEIAWTYHTVEALRRGQIPTLNDTDYALIELWPNITWGEVRKAAKNLLNAGFTPVFSHIERYRCFVWQPERAIELKNDLPVCYQLNASALLCPGGLIMKHFMRRMLGEQTIDAIASDAHDVQNRPVQMAEVRRALEGQCSAGYARRMMCFEEVLG